MSEYVVFIRYGSEYLVAFTNAIGSDAAIELVVEERMAVRDQRQITDRRVVAVSDMDPA